MMTEQQLRACPNFAEHGLMQGCGLCNPALVPVPDAERMEQLKADVTDALAAVSGRHEAEQLRLANDVTLQRLGQQGLTIAPNDITNLHLALLLDTVLGDMDSPARQAYEIKLHTMLAGLLADIGAQAARAKLMQGIQIDPRGNGGPRRG